MFILTRNRGRKFPDWRHLFNSSMRLTQLLYLLSFFAPIAFLLGYIAGAPRPVVTPIHLERIDTRTLPVAPVDFYRHESSLVVAETNWLRPNSWMDPK